MEALSQESQSSPNKDSNTTADPSESLSSDTGRQLMLSILAVCERYNSTQLPQIPSVTNEPVQTLTVIFRKSLPLL
jgi:hypothetical protein